MRRPERNVFVKTTILIVAEGAKTETNYFWVFRNIAHANSDSNVNIDIKGEGKNTVSLVAEAVKLKKENNYDEIWCVFDRDSFPAKNFNQAIQLAEKNNIKVAYSNQSFEVWFLLHFSFLQSNINRDKYEDMLTNFLGFKYEKNHTGMYDVLKECQIEAINNAKRLLDKYNEGNKVHNPEKDNPSRDRLKFRVSLV